MNLRPATKKYFLNNSLLNPKMDVMNFLNEINSNYPDAISFASGRPADQFFNVRKWSVYADEFIKYTHHKTKINIDSIYKNIGQYGRTNGIINNLISKMLRYDENIEIDKEDIVVTCGCQEAMSIILDALFRDSNDILIVTEPTYIGITGLATLRGITVKSVVPTSKNHFIDNLTKLIRDLKKNGKYPKAFYVIPDFNNPTGTSLSLNEREQILKICENENIIIIEDNPYGMFRYEGKKISTLKSLDNNNIVLYLGTFSKLISPALRVGFIAGNPKIINNERISSEFSKIKSLTTVNTSQYLQAIIGGILIENNCSLQNYIQPMINFYQGNRNRILNELDKHFSVTNEYDINITWNRPEGGYFIQIELPFVVSKSDVKICAEKFSIIFMPMSFFSLTNNFDNYIRIAFSNVSHDEINMGIKMLKKYIINTIQNKKFYLESE